MKYLLVLLLATGCSCQHSPVSRITTLEPFDFLHDKAFVCVFEAETKEMICGNFEATLEALKPQEEQYNYY